MSAGELRERITFAERTPIVGDGYGNEEATFADKFTVSARVTPLRGGETIMAARLEGRQPVAIKVRSTTDTRQIKSDWQAKDARSGVVYAINSIANQDEHDQYLTILATEGDQA